VGLGLALDYVSVDSGGHNLRPSNFPLLKIAVVDNSLHAHTTTPPSCLTRTVCAPALGYVYDSLALRIPRRSNLCPTNLVVDKESCAAEREDEQKDKRTDKME
jgi:hypothetical protein